MADLGGRFATRCTMDSLHVLMGVFVGRNGGQIGRSTIATMLRRTEVDCVPHGFRSSFRNWTEECTDTPRSVAEAALAHVNQNQTEAAYLRTDLLDRRRVLMESLGSIP